ncbi:LysR family transcriptional regulator [Pseudoalteromonas gelatinilytica]
MDIVKSITVFQHVVKEMSFSKAAEALNLTPSAVSRQVTELEKWLGVRLLNRTTRMIQLSDEGSQYMEKMNEIIDYVQELQLLKNDASILYGRIKLTAPMMLGQYILPQLLAEFRSLHPKLALSLALMNRKVDLIEEGYDLALRVGMLADSTLHARKIGSIAFKTVASKAYLQKNGIPKFPKDLVSHQCLINTNAATPRKWQYQVNGQDVLIKVDGTIESNDSMSLLSFAKQGLGIVVLPDLYVNDAIDRGELAEVLPHNHRPSLPINMVYTSNRYLSPSLRTLIDFLFERFADEYNKGLIEHSRK